MSAVGEDLNILFQGFKCLLFFFCFLFFWVCRICLGLSKSFGVLILLLDYKFEVMFFPFPKEVTAFFHLILLFKWVSFFKCIVLAIEVECVEFDDTPLAQPMDASNQCLNLVLARSCLFVVLLFR